MKFFYKPSLIKWRITKLLRIMRITTLLLLIGLMQTYATNSYSQNTKLSLKMENASIETILSKIEKISEFHFFFRSNEINSNDRHTIDASEQTIDEVLNSLLKDSKLTYKIFDKYIAIVSKENANGNIESLIQQKAIFGKVTDQAGVPLPGVSVVVKGTTTGVITDNSGNFTLTNIPENAILQFSFVGMKAQEVSVGNKTTINLVMAEETIGLEEVVAIGYGTQRKVTLTGSVASSKGNEIQKSPGTNLTNNLAGRIPGLTAVTRSGEPGADGATLRIRGSNTLGDNSPLIVVDGTPNRGMERINPSDIENVTVLKDASAAIYGAQAANGVILITTKRGSLGKPKVTLNMSQGLNQPTRIPKMADAAQYATMLNEILYYKNKAGGRNQKYSADDIQKYSDGSDPWGHPNTDWFGEVFKPWSSQNQQNASISGGSENMKYFISLGAKFEDGYYKNSATNYKQYDFRTNIDGKINKYINVAFDVAGRQEMRSYPNRPTGDPIFRTLMHSKPTMHAYWPNGTPGPDIEEGDNPAITTTDATGYDRDKLYVIQSNLRTNIIIPWINGLTISTNASYDKTFRFHKKFVRPWYLYTWDGNADHITTKNKKGFDGPELSEDMADGQNITLNVYATYEKTFETKHNIKAMVGTERRSGTNDVFSAFRKNYISAAVDQLFAGATDQYMSNDGSASHNAYLSYFGRLNYDLSKKYMAEFVWRYDGSYKFPTAKQFGFFPGISVGWRISDENFWKNNISYINDFKIRGSWGQTGNDRIEEYQYLATYGYVDNSTYVYGTEDNKLLIETKSPNINVTWEVANQANIGFDAFLFNNKISVSADYFNNIRSQILIRKNASIPASSGLTLPPENIGKVQNGGFEASIGYHGEAGEFKYDISVNGSYSKNKIIFWDETPGIPDYQRSTGRPMGSALYYEAIGIFKDQAQIDATPHWPATQPGDIIFKDVNPDGVINGLDRVMNEKSNMPRFIGGFNINLKYRQFDLAMLIQGAAGAQLYITAESGEVGNYYKDFADNRWTPENTDASYPRSYNRSDEYWRSQGNTFWLRSTDYIRLKNFELGYTLPLNVNKILGIENLRIYVNGLNLVTIDKSKVLDPEVSDGSGWSYPLQRVVNCGLTLTF